MSHKVKSSISFAVNGKPATPAEFREALQTLVQMHPTSGYEMEMSESGHLVRKRRIL